MVNEVDRHSNQLNDMVPGMVHMSGELKELRKQAKVNQEVILGLARNLDRYYTMIAAMEDRLRVAEQRLERTVGADDEQMDMDADYETGESTA